MEQDEERVRERKKKKKNSSELNRFTLNVLELRANRIHIFYAYQIEKWLGVKGAAAKISA